MNISKIFCIPPISIFNATPSLILKYADNLGITFWHKNIKCQAMGPRWSDEWLSTKQGLIKLWSNYIAWKTYDNPKNIT